MSEHAVLSASSSKKWINCPPSARLEEQFPDTTSDYAREGTLAHSIAELKVRKYFIEPMSQRTFNSRLKKLQKQELYAPEMLTHTDTYLEYIQGIAYSCKSAPFVTVEKRLDYSDVAPEGFGTGDCILISGDTLHIIDFKYGKGVPVYAEGNTQMMLYAVGAIKAYSMLYAINNVVMTIVQPRLDIISEHAISVSELNEWAESVKSVAELAYKGEGEFHDGDWCKFCRARATCRKRSENITALEAFGGKLPPLLSDDEVGGILETARRVKKWVDDIEEYALTAILSGKNIPGWKAVEGRKCRTFTDSEKAFAAITEKGYEESMLYERKPLSLTNIEKLMGKKDFEAVLSEYVTVSTGKPALAPASDSRKEFTNKITAQEAFKQEEK